MAGAFSAFSAPQTAGIIARYQLTPRTARHAHEAGKAQMLLMLQTWNPRLRVDPWRNGIGTDEALAAFTSHP